MFSQFNLTSRHKMILGWLLVLSMVGWGVFRMSRRLSDEPYIDFQAFYLAAEAARTGDNPYRAGDEVYVYPPMLAAWMAPLSLLNVTQAAWVWFGLTLVGTFGSLYLVWITLKNRLNWKTVPGDGILALGITLLIWQTQCRWEFEQGQTDWLTLCALSIAFAALDRFPAVVGLALGFAINIKYMPLMVVVYLAIRQRWLAVAWAFVATIFWSMAPALVYGWDKNLLYLSQGLAGLAKIVGIEVAGQAYYVMPLTYDRSITFPSMWARVAQTYGHGMGYIIGMTALTALVVFAIGWIIYRTHHVKLFSGRGGLAEKLPSHRGCVALEFWLTIILMLTFSPQAQMRHFYLLLPMVLTTAGLLVCGSTATIRSLALVGLVVGVCGSIGADIFTLFGMRESWKYISGAAVSTLAMGFLTLAAGFREVQYHLDPVPGQDIGQQNDGFNLQPA
jgi:hypothetical protein